MVAAIVRNKSDDRNEFQSSEKCLEKCPTFNKIPIIVKSPETNFQRLNPTEVEMGSVNLSRASVK